MRRNFTESLIQEYLNESLTEGKYFNGLGKFDKEVKTNNPEVHVFKNSKTGEYKAIVWDKSGNGRSICGSIGVKCIPEDNYNITFVGSKEDIEKNISKINSNLTKFKVLDESLNESVNITGSGNYAVVIFDCEDSYAEIKRFATFDEAQNFLKEAFLQVRELDVEGTNWEEDFDEEAGYNPETKKFDRPIDHFSTLYHALDKPVSYDFIDLSKGKYVVCETSTDSFTNYSEPEVTLHQFSDNAKAQKFLQASFLDERDFIDEDYIEEYDEQVGYDKDTNTFLENITDFSTNFGDEFGDVSIKEYKLIVF